MFCEVRAVRAASVCTLALGKKEKRMETEGEGLTLGTCYVPVLSALNALFHLHFSCGIGCCYPYFIH